MSETKEKKLRVSAYAAEINISTEDIISFLQKKGYKTVKTPNSPLTEEMLNDLNIHFKKDIEKAEKHHKKKEELHKLFGDAKQSDDKKATEKKSAKKSDKVIEPETVEQIEPVVVQEKPVEEITLEKIEPAVVSEPVREEPLPEQVTEKKPAEEIFVTEQPVAEPEPPVEVAETIQEVTAEETVPEPESPEVVDTQATQPKPQSRGLKIIGHIRDKKAVPEEAPVVPPSEVAQPQVTATADEGEEKKPRKKKKQKTKRKIEAPTAEEILAGKKKTLKPKKFEIDQREVEENIKATLLGIDDTGISSSRALARKKKKKERQEQEMLVEEQKRIEQKTITVTEFIAVNELANLMGVNVAEVIQKCFGLGIMVSINQRLDVETISLVADEFGYKVEIAKEYTSEALEDIQDDEQSLIWRPPIVTIMGHVDHGKTSLLDYIRNTNVVAGEAGGITQHIGAYKVDLGNGKSITFLDTPGHAAFTAMRARGAQVTDIVVLVVAADDAVMPQTVEAIDHARAANVPIIVAINKIDRAEANPDKIKQQLADRNILVEEWGGKYQCVELSAKKGTNVDVLLEKILLEAELLDLKANPNRSARGFIIESELDKGRGVTATVLVQKGSLRVGDPFIAGIYFGKVRAMFDERQKKVEVATPSTPVRILGFEGAPQAGDIFISMESEREARAIAQKRQALKREQDNKQIRHITLDEISRQISVGGVKELPIIVKGDVDGSVEALADSFMKLSNQEVVVRVIHRGVGAISEGDVLLADASNAIIIGFHVRPNLNARKYAEAQKVDIRIYNVIYDAINEVKLALEGLLSPIISEETTATIEVRETFKVPKVGTVAGCYVQEGKIVRNHKVRLIREGIVIYEGELLSLKRFKDDVREVEAGYECGISLQNYNDIKIGDIIEGYKIIETKKKLS